MKIELTEFVASILLLSLSIAVIMITCCVYATHDSTQNTASIEKQK